MLPFLITGYAIGIAAAAPVGPVALLIVRRTLTDGRLAGFASGLGAATADLVCGSIAACAMNAVTDLLESHRAMVKLIGGLFMLALGAHTVRAKIHDTARRPLHERNLAIAYVSTAGLTIANPLTLLGLVGLVAGVGWADRDATLLQTEFFVAGIVLGSSSWWLALVSCSNWLGRKLGQTTLLTINRLAGLFIVLFGAWQLIDVIRHRS
jgi:threonine/homoserine/homoserine lactone efflux protein